MIKRCVLFSVAPSCPTLCGPRTLAPPGSSVHGTFPGKNTGVGCHFHLLLTQGLKLLQPFALADRFFTTRATGWAGYDLTKTLCAKQMEVLWVPADLISFLCVLSKKKSHWTKVNWQGMRLKHCNHESQSRSVMPDSLWPQGLCSPWNSSGQNTGVGSLSLLQGIFPTQGSNPGFPHCTWILYQLSHQESPIMLQSWGEAKPSFSYTSRK